MTKAVQPFRPRDCPWRDRILPPAGMMGITFGHAGVEYYAFNNGDLYRVAKEGEIPHACYPKTSLAHPHGIPLVACVIIDAPESAPPLCEPGAGPDIAD